jgi:hypothetical protein
VFGHCNLGGGSGDGGGGDGEVGNSDVQRGHNAMLPDYPKVKSLLEKAIQERIRRAKDRRLGVFSQVKQTQLHEGRSLYLSRADGSSETVEMEHMRASAEIQHDIREIDSLDFEGIVRMADSLGEKLAAEQIKLCVRRIEEGVREVGNVANSSMPLIEQLFDLWTKVHIDFSNDGTPELPTLVMASEAAVEKAKEAITQIESDPVLRKRRNEIIEQKRQEWRDRETARNLVE